MPISTPLGARTGPTVVTAPAVGGAKAAYPVAVVVERRTGLRLGIERRGDDRTALRDGARQRVEAEARHREGGQIQVAAGLGDAGAGAAAKAQRATGLAEART